MPGKEFTPQYWQVQWENIILPQEVQPDEIPELHRIFTSTLPRGKLSLIEIGCAPGKWMAYFFRQFGFSVSGIDYVSTACAKTRDNLERLSIPARIHDTDLMDYESSHPYDIVFSAGFIEHFQDPRIVMARLVRLCRPDGGLIITMIPSLEGLNRWISRTFRPRVADGHFPMNLPQLRTLHETFGFQTLRAAYVGSLEILTPMKKNRFAAEHETISLLLNLPFSLWNRMVKKVTGIIGIYPQIGWVTNSLIYIGRRNSVSGPRGRREPVEG